MPHMVSTPGPVGMLCKALRSTASKKKLRCGQTQPTLKQSTKSCPPPEPSDASN